MENALTWLKVLVLQTQTFAKLTSMATLSILLLYYLYNLSKCFVVLFFRHTPVHGS